MKGSNFQIIVAVIFVFFTIVGVGTFAIFTSGGGQGGVGKVEVWGTMDKNTVDTWLTALNDAGSDAVDDVTYTQLASANYEAVVANAMAAGRGPDLLMVSDNTLLFFGDKVQTIPYGTYSQGTYTTAFVDEAALFLTAEGPRALPIIIDPLVMYWNRDMLAGAGIANPPAYWNDLIPLAPRLTKLDAGQNVQKSAIAMGTWRNVANAKAIVAALMLQAGESIAAYDESGILRATLARDSMGESPAASALRFYTEFANPGKTTYSWSNAREVSTNAFLAGDVAFYVGFAGEYPSLRERNPNLRFDAAVLPQLRQGTPATMGRIAGLAVARGSDNPQGALALATILSGREAIATLAGILPLPAVRRDVAVDTSASTAGAVFTQSALIARGWLDPDSPRSDIVFKDMIESVLSGAADPTSAVIDAAADLDPLYAGKQ